MEVLAFILRAIEPIGASVWPARPACLSRTCRANRAHDFARVFRVRLLCRVVDTEALPDRCGRCRALDCSQDNGASEFVNSSSHPRPAGSKAERLFKYWGTGEPGVPRGRKSIRKWLRGMRGQGPQPSTQMWSLRCGIRMPRLVRPHRMP